MSRFTSMMWNVLIRMDEDGQGALSSGQILKIKTLVKFAILYEN